MGLTATALHLITPRAARLATTERVYTYGVQDIWADYNDLRRIFKKVGVSYTRIPEHQRTPSPSSIFQADTTRPGRVNVDASVYFRMLGFHEYRTIDLLDIDGPPDIRHDLNLPIPDALEGTADLLIDGGTTEHIFDVRTALINSARLIRPGGMVVHFNPVLMYEHGFYGINPTVLVDFYSQNGFRIVDVFCIVGSGSVQDHYRQNWCFPYSSEFLPPSNVLTGHIMNVLFFAQRVSSSDKGYATPLQGYYERLMKTRAADEAGSNVTRTRRLKLSMLLSRLPAPISQAVRTWKWDFDRWRRYRSVRFQA